MICQDRLGTSTRRLQRLKTAFNCVSAGGRSSRSKRVRRMSSRAAQCDRSIILLVFLFERSFLCLSIGVYWSYWVSLRCWLAGWLAGRLIGREAVARGGVRGGVRRAGRARGHVRLRASHISPTFFTPQAVFGTDGATVVPVSPTEEGPRDPETFPPDDTRAGELKPAPLELSAEQVGCASWAVPRGLYLARGCSVRQQCVIRLNPHTAHCPRRATRHPDPSAQVRGTVGPGGNPIPAPAPSSACRSYSRQQELTQAHLGGLTRRLPPDRPTAAAVHRQRGKFTAPSPRRFAKSPHGKEQSRWLSLSASSMLPLPAASN